MELAAIAFEENSFIPAVRDAAAANDLLASPTPGQGRFLDGFTAFCEYFGLSFLQLSSFDEETRRASSKKISAELMEFHDGAVEPGILRMLEGARASLPPKFFLVFACDWNAGDPVRCERMSIAQVRDHFVRNNGWYLWLYNYSAGAYFPKLDVPLVIEVTNG
jgi:hypothetical protein